jgi:hypothetical protein
LYNFWSHPEGRTNEGHSLGFDVCKLCSDTKISDLDFALF